MSVLQRYYYRYCYHIHVGSLCFAEGERNEPYSPVGDSIIASTS